MTKPNQYDNLRVDIQRLHAAPLQGGQVLARQNLCFVGALIKTGLYPRLVDSGFIRDWFNEFHHYWVKVLGGRPLKLHDFFYLYSDYRKRYQTIELRANQDFLEAWQLPENIYSVFNAVYKYAHHPLSFYPFKKYIKEANNVLEYGCGIAPITYSVVKYGVFQKKHFTIADIPSFTFHFAKWRLQNEKKVKALALSPFVRSVIQTKYDLVFLMTVLEHLPDPLAVLGSLHCNLNPGGVLVFDFVLGEGKGLDSKQSIVDREKMLRFVEDNFVVEVGKLQVDKSMGTTIVRKR